MNDRYSRQILFSPIGKVGQEKLLNSRVLLVGCGALGASHAEMLARAGVGKLRIVDRDFVEFTNLQRQTLFKESDAAERLPKAVAARARIAEINSQIDVEAVVADVNNSNIESLIEGCDLVLDGTDNFQVRYLINDACVKHKKPWIYGAAVSSYGTTMTILPGRTPCLRCIFEEMPDAGSAPTCDTAGVIMPIISSISAIQVAEALKLLVSDTDSLHRSLIQIDVWQNDWRKVKLGGPDPDCKTCGKRNFEFLDADAQEFSAVLCGRNAVQIAPPRPTTIDLENFAAKLSNIPDIKWNKYLVRFTVNENEVTVFRDGRAIIKGTDNVTAARSLYSRYIGA
ncbi:MAG: thiazole biosynthesis adenylyltransferase ThiF [Acidobacteria bacterium]|nr:thiazole biosynthesis adenylyltransferase ThiF [Acidobacteriota bacterium]